MAEVKVTIKDMFNEIIALAEENGREDIVEFAKGRIAQLEKKSSNRKNDKKSEENEVLKGVILDTMVGMEPSTVSAIMNANSEVGTYSNQKISAMLRQLESEGKVVKTKDKKSTLFAVVEG